ncbi:MAG TPA: CbiQ family ECF transporter T component [Candidatus Sericytochromatia bacterium]|jgi:energy-coupling factor transport system permease protein
MDLLRSLPLGLYLEQPVTWLHHLDSRVKFIWLMSFLAAPLVDNPYWRLALVVLLILLTLSAAIPLRVWRQQMGWLLMLATFIFVLSAIAPDGLAINPQPRLPQSQLVLAQPTNYNYVLWSAGPATITRRSLALAVRVSTLLFTLIYSTNLFLLTTAPEEITAGLESLMRPLRRFNLPVTEITLTLTLSLRFIPLVLEEVQNLVRSVRTRAINWKKLGIRKSLQVWLMVSERLLENLLLRAEQIASAMTVRGFTSPSEHRVQWHQLRLHQGDWIAIGSLLVFWGVGLGWRALL